MRKELNNHYLINWYKENNKNIEGLFKAKLHQSDVGMDEKIPDFFIDKINGYKIYYIPWLNINIPNSRITLMHQWAEVTAKHLGYIYFNNFIISEWYPTQKQLNKELILNYHDKLETFVNELILIQTHLELKLIPRDYSSISIVDKEIKILTLFDFELDYKEKETIIFDDEELVSYNINTKELLEFNNIPELKEYLITKGQQCLKLKN